jgi:predicted flap endonuclease-1-like 5' DNA nuclease
MGLIDTIKSIFGLSSNEQPRGGDGDVTVEHDPAAAETDAAASTESLVDEDGDTAVEATEVEAPTEPSVDPEAGGAVESDVDIAEAETDPPHDEANDPVAAETDAAASTESLVNENVDAPAEAAEPPEAHSPTEPSVDPEAGGAVESGVTIDEAETPPTDEDDVESDPPEDDSDEHVETVRGIGPAYAERLADAGVETVGDLAAADAGALSRQIDVAESRIVRWIDRARDRRGV